MFDLNQFKDRIIIEKVTPKREASYADFPKQLLPEIKEYLTREGRITRLYSHQAEMFAMAEKGGNIVITTSTASGKTLSFLLPILQQILKDPLTRAIFVYPTKALASDQYRSMEPILNYFGKNKVQAGVYDGDTPVNERSRLRSSANIILTNPEMLNSAFLPNHHSYGFNFIFSNLKYVVIDELHSYRGAFGSHLANIFKRTARISKYYHSSPQFFCSSATIANPVELAENICGGKFELVDTDGSPAPEKHYFLWQPPVIKDTLYRISPNQDAANLIPELTAQNRSFIAFCKSRKAVEVVLKESRDKLKYDGFIGQDISSLIAGYRGGYKPEERKEIEKKMVNGQLKGLVSTNALELGIDIGSIDSTVIVGFPGTRASFWQQSGRAGRKGRASNTFLILDNLPFDQYIAIDPEWLFSNGVENAVVDKNNLFIQLAHVRAAAAEIPLSLDDVSLFPDLGEILPVLISAGEVQNQKGKFVWIGKEYPAGEYSLRNMDNVRYKLINNSDHSAVTEMDEIQAYRELYPGAIYMHEGQMFQVLSLDTTAHTAEAKPTDLNYYTVPHDPTKVRKIQELKASEIGRSERFFGDVRVTTIISGFKRIQFHNHQNLGFDELREPLSKSFETEGFWIDIPGNVYSQYMKLIPRKRDALSLEYWKDYFDGLTFTLLNSAMMLTMTTREDMGAELLIDPIKEEAGAAICIFDMYVGGLGFADKVYDYAHEIINGSIKMVEGCRCKDGCPACVGDYTLDKNLVLWGLRNIFEEMAPPSNLKIPEKAPKVYLMKEYKLEELPERWDQFREFIGATGEYLSDFIATIPSIRVENGRLYLLLKNEFYNVWLSEANNKMQLQNMITNYVAVAKDFSVEFEIQNEGSKIMNEKIAKRFDDLTK
ncbi:MAG: DEAD/DEAH box helicase [Eubacteriaceae bacterium]|nr:DEAD/DEAH box helicase [Eubacteriaceae bacterium]